MRIKKSKVKVMNCFREGKGTELKVRIGDVPVQEVWEFIYQGSKITSDRQRKTDIKSRIAEGKEPHSI